MKSHEGLVPATCPRFTSLQHVPLCDQALKTTSVYVHLNFYFAQLVDPPDGFIFGTIKDTSTEDFFRKSQSARLRKIYENMKDHNVETFADGLKKLRSG